MFTRKLAPERQNPAFQLPIHRENAGHATALDMGDVMWNRHVPPAAVAAGAAAAFYGIRAKHHAFGRSRFTSVAGTALCGIGAYALGTGSIGMAALALAAGVGLKLESAAGARYAATLYGNAVYPARPVGNTCWTALVSHAGMSTLFSTSAGLCGATAGACAAVTRLSQRHPNATAIAAVSAALTEGASAWQGFRGVRASTPRASV